MRFADVNASFKPRLTVSAFGTKLKPYEDAICWGRSEDSLVVAIADGVSQIADRHERYFSSEHPRQAAELAVRIARDTILQNLSIGETVNSVIALAFKKSIVALQERFGHMPSDANRPGAVMTVAILKRGRLYYGHIGDCSLRLIRNSGNTIYQITETQTAGLKWWAEHVTHYFPDEKLRTIHSRATYRNNVKHRYGYGVLNGELDALEFIEQGRIVVDRNEIVVMHTDGVAGIFEAAASDPFLRSRLIDLVKSSDIDSIVKLDRVSAYEGRTRCDDATIALVSHTDSIIES